jgi:hypothetical protein
MKLKIPTRSKWNKARAYQKGYWSYMYAKHKWTNIPENNPYVLGNWAWHQFVLGVKKAMLDAQDSEE